jgi:hypothetical protein
MGKDLRGGCDSMPLRWAGPWCGYNTGATMQVGLWIRNDGDHIAWARRHAHDGPVYLRQVLTSLMQDSYRDEKRQGLAEEMLSLPASVWLAVLRSEGGADAIDWAQICFDLVYVEPDEQDMAAAQRDIDEAREEWGVEDDTARGLAVRRREILAAEIAMTGVER